MFLILVSSHLIMSETSFHIDMYFTFLFFAHCAVLLFLSFYSSSSSSFFVLFFFKKKKKKKNMLW
jgi:hypothetical protein